MMAVLRFKFPATAHGPLKAAAEHPVIPKVLTCLPSIQKNSVLSLNAFRKNPECAFKNTIFMIMESAELMLVLTGISIIMMKVRMNLLKISKKDSISRRI